MSNCTQMTGHSWSYWLLNVKLTIFFVKFQAWYQKTSTSPHFISTSISMQCPIICRSSVKISFSESFSFPCNWSFERHDHWKMDMAHRGRMKCRTLSNNFIWNYRTRSKLMFNWINIITFFLMFSSCKKVYPNPFYCHFGLSTVKLWISSPKGPLNFGFLFH